MAWYLGGVRIYVEEDSGWIPNYRNAEVNVLDSSQTIIHTAGRESYKRDLTFVVFSGYVDNVLPLASGVHSLISDQGVQGDVRVMSLKGKRLFDISRVTPVFRVTLNVIKDGV